LTAVPVDQPERTTLGRYRLIKKLAVGGMAEIYLARMTGAGGFEKNVVLKRILPQLAEDDELYRMFVDEARIAATLQHPNIVQVYDCGETDGEFFIAMEFLDGADLQTIRGTLAQRKKGLPLIHTIHVASAVAAGLHYAHEKTDLEGNPLYIVHRDVTPANILLTRDGGIKLVDFGIAKAANRLTRTSYGTLKGKIAYMSPEQVQGEDIDRRSDIYSLGILLYEMTTGRRLYQGKAEYAVLKEIVEQPIPPPTSIHERFPKDLEEIILRSLSKDPATRYQTARAFGQALEGFARSRQLMLSGITLAEYLAPVLEDAKDYAASRLERMKDRAKRLTAPQGSESRRRKPPSESAEQRFSAPTMPPPARSGAAAPAHGEASLDRASDHGDARAAQATAAALAATAAVEAIPDRLDQPLAASREVMPALPASDVDDPLSAWDVHVDLSAVRLRRRPIVPIVLLVLLIAGAGTAAFMAYRSSQEPTAEPAAPPVTSATLTLTSTPPGAALWLAVGRAPSDTVALDPGGSYLLRVEHEGYQPSLVTVAATDFVTGAGGAAPVAEVAASLSPAVPGEAGPSPEALPADAPAGGLGPAASRRGHIHITADRAAAEVWLYLGRSPAEVTGLDPTRHYELRVVAEGFTPFYREVEAADLASGALSINAALSAAPPGPSSN
jgi:serine/threonine protein kinase